jgi:3-deoxy-D-manno-octulosonic-acid transferase
VVLDICRKRNLRAHCLSQLNLEGSEEGTQVVVVDAIGHLKTLYRMANVAFIGGSLVPFGGHNPLEPAMFAKPILFGPDMSDFRHIADLLLEAGAALKVQDGNHLKATFVALLDNPERQIAMGRRAKMVVQAHQGAVEKTLKCINLAGQ